MESISQSKVSKHPRVLIVCPQTLVGEGLKMILAQEEDLRLIGLAVDVDDASTSLHQLEPDVIVLAFGWGDQDCAAAVRRFKSERPGLPVIIVSPVIRVEQVQEALAAGTEGYLTLEASPDELIHAIYTASRSEFILHPTVVAALLRHLGDYDGDKTPLNRLDFSPREQEVLACLARGLSDRGIAQQLFISVRTVQTHLAHIYAKLGVHSRVEAALAAMRAGRFFPPR
ncbi:MAG TPA: response regulator transcription factor [Anaerolineales bacterium]